MRALISVHDVMPETLPWVRPLVERLQEQGHSHMTLLVVPGCAWRPAEIDYLAACQEAGAELAAHGWSHRAERLRGVKHRLHAALISRQAAEHLELDGQGIIQRMGDAAAWFSRSGLGVPTSYVPPAWALGRVPYESLRVLPFERIEVTTGMLDTRSGAWSPLPLLGFEADTAPRAAFLRSWNRLQRAWARWQGGPLRVAIHPYDDTLRLHRELGRVLAEMPASLRYDQLGC